MDEKRAKKLGKMLRVARESLGLSTVEVGVAADVDQATIWRLENGSILVPKPDKLARIAKVLNLSAADLFAAVDYTVPKDLPSMRPYLRTRYGQLPASELKKIEAYAEEIAKQNGISLTGPAPGEDE